MSKTRKILSVVLAVVLVFALSVPAFANWEADENGYSQTWALGTPVATGNANEYTIDVYLTADYAVGGVQFALDFTGDVQLTGVALGTDYYASAQPLKSPEGSTSTKVALVPITAGANTIPAMESIDGVIAVLTVTGTLGTVSIREDAKSATNTDGTLIATRVEPADLVLGTQYVGQETVAVGASVSIGAVPADLALKAGAPAGIVIDKNKTFGGAYAGVVYGFDVAEAGAVIKATTMYTDSLEATNGGSLEFTAIKVGRNNCYGTNAKIVVKNSDGTVSKTYVIVIFGDLDCNGAVTADDTGYVYAHVKGDAVITDEVKIMAANTVTAGRTASAKEASMYEITADDTGVVYAHVKGTKVIDQVSAAALQNTYNANYQ